MEQQEHFHAINENVNRYKNFGKIFDKMEVHIPHNPEIPFLGMCSGEILTSEHKERATRMFPVLFFIKVKKIRSNL